MVELQISNNPLLKNIVKLPFLVTFVLVVGYDYVLLFSRYSLRSVYRKHRYYGDETPLAPDPADSLWWSNEHSCHFRTAWPQSSRFGFAAWVHYRAVRRDCCCRHLSSHDQGIHLDQFFLIPFITICHPRTYSIKPIFRESYNTPDPGPFYTPTYIRREVNICLLNSIRLSFFYT